MGRPLRRVPGLGIGRRGGRAHAARRRRAGVRAGGARSGRSPIDRGRSRAPAACPSSTACSAAGWCRARRSCWPASPGVGKRTLLLEVAAQTARTRQRTLYVTGEESAAQVRLRADRTGGVHDELFLAAETDLGAVLTHIEEVARRCWSSTPIQTIGASGIDGVPGGRHPGQGGRRRADPGREDAQHRHGARRPRHQGRLHRRAAGARAPRRRRPRTSRASRNSRLRMVRAIKNRFGPVDEVGCFDLSSDGISAVTDPTGLFVEHHHAGRLRHLRGRDDGGTPAAAGRGAGAADAVAARAAPPHGLGRGVVAGRHGARRAPAPRPAADRRQRHLRRDRRRRQAARSRGRPGDRGRRRPARTSACRRREAPWPSARSASPASCAGCATCRSGIAEAPRLGFKVAVVPRGRALPERARDPLARVVDGLRVVEVDDVVGALLTLDLTPPL